MKPISRRALLRTGAAAAVLTTLPAGAQSLPKPLLLDDASRLNAVPIARHWRPARVTGEAWLDALRAELKAAAAEGRPVAVGAARHSMGGQALVRDGVAMTFDVKPATDSWLRSTGTPGPSASPPARGGGRSSARSTASGSRRR